MSILLIIVFFFFYRLLNPVLKRLDKSKQKELESQIQKQFDPIDVCFFYYITIKFENYVIVLE